MLIIIVILAAFGGCCWLCIDCYRQTGVYKLLSLRRRRAWAEARFQAARRQLADTFNEARDRMDEAAGVRPPGGDEWRRELRVYRSAWSDQAQGRSWRSDT